MKRKSMATLIGGLLSACLIGVGFASWIIVQDGEASLQGTVHVETVSDNSVYIEASWASSDADAGQFNFTAPTAATTDTKNWLVSTTENAEKLELDVNVKIINATKVDGDVQVSWDTSSLTAYEKYIKPVATSNISIPAVGEGTGTWGEEHGVKTYTTTITLAFEWGTYFGGNNNPYAFYNAKGARELVKDTVGFTSAHATVDGHDAETWTWADEAEYVLTELYGANDKITKLTLTAKAKRTEN